ncbi:MAG: hypothetical protein KF883_09990 [Thermomicrobiales bacterium]|nr:hypothetical protein [Thermomicrobiales bacterium]
MNTVFAIAMGIARGSLLVSTPVYLASIPAALVLFVEEWGDWRTLALVVLSLILAFSPLKVLFLLPAASILERSWESSTGSEMQLWSLIGSFLFTLVFGASVLLSMWVVAQALKSLGWI